MSQVLSEETHRNMLARIPHCTGREVSDWLRTVEEEGPLPLPLRGEGQLAPPRYDLAYGHAKAIVHETT
ncbi:hypothetical protein SHIRM173S_03793 [Streptomyces hirsutus]